MRKIIVLTLFPLFSIAQVSNDSCLSASDLGYFWGGTIDSVSLCIDGTTPYVFTDSTDNAVVNFPYPSNPLPCNGYTANIAAPAKDIWYKFKTDCEFNFRVENSDTLHLSFWVGDTCSNLVPIACYTIPAGIIYLSPTLYVGYLHYIFMQISGPSISSVLISGFVFLLL